MVKDIKQNPTELIRSSAAEYLTFIAASGKGGALRKIPLTMQDRETRLNRFIETTDRMLKQSADTPVLGNDHGDNDEPPRSQGWDPTDFTHLGRRGTRESRNC